MAKFCKQCSLELFGKDNEDFLGLTSKSKWEDGVATVVMCEGCGLIQVSPEGSCASDDCLKKKKPGHGVKWFNE